MALWEACWGDFSPWGQKCPKWPSVGLPGVICRAGARNAQSDLLGSLLGRFLAQVQEMAKLALWGGFLGRFLALGPEMAKMAF